MICSRKYSTDLQEVAGSRQPREEVLMAMGEAGEDLSSHAVSADKCTESAQSARPDAGPFLLCQGNNQLHGQGLAHAPTW